MIWLGLITCVAFVPGWTGATIPTGWAVLSCLLPLSLWRPVRWTSLHWGIFATVVYAHVAVLWSIGDQNITGLWQFDIFFLAFYLGSTLDNLRDLLRGCAIGMAISSAVAVAQAFGFQPVLHFSPAPAGIFFNSVAQGLMIALVILGLVIERLWWYIPAMLPGLWLCQSRGAWVALAFGLLATRWRSPGWLIALALSSLAYIASLGVGSDSLRIQIWLSALTHLRWFGNGPGTFLNLYLSYGGSIVRPEYVHNDYIQLVFEYGLGSAPILLTFAALYFSWRSHYWPIYVAFAVSASFVFPMHIAPVVLLAGAVSGNVAADWLVAWSNGRDRRPTLVSRDAVQQPTPA